MRPRRLVIDPNRASGKDAFRLAGSGAEVTVSEKIKDRFEQHKLTGAIFGKVS
ncbi:imm11 family protein [Ochrobactrum teleogrylli]|uniref:imm11 family protein n=1 Tax=Ochrobactrum teleogrylli TaxID=2479765 RepID=UPI0015DE0A7E